MSNHQSSLKNSQRHANLAPYERWVLYVETQTAEKIVSLYHPECILLPTFSQTILTTQEERTNYFSELKKQPVHISTQMREALHLEKNILINSGYYTFHVDNHGEKVDHYARFTFVFQKEHPEADWLIRLHQSSLA